MWSENMNILTLSERQNGNCCYCGNVMIQNIHIDGVPTHPKAMTKDHVVCKSHGGKNHHNNLVAACFQCNNLRSSVDDLIFSLILYIYFLLNKKRKHRWHEHQKHELRRIREILWRFDRRRREVCLPGPILYVITSFFRGLKKLSNEPEHN